MFKKILIVNRGEIAVRIIKACREMEIASAVVYSEVDKNSLHVRAADGAYFIGQAAASESYLHHEKIINLARKIGADAIHPGYGFLSENSEFIKKVEATDIVFIGPSAESVSMMGEKTSARTIMKRNKVPIVPGSTESIRDLESAYEVVDSIGYPVMLKAAAGGGGKGMRKVYNKEEFEPAFERAKNESQKAFGNSDIYIEKFIEKPKHIEVQVLADHQGNYIHLFERECSVQRRHQKVIEEAPSSAVNEDTRQQLGDTAINAAKACNYLNAGTIEFLMDVNKNFYFLEMNTRLQVEHPVTEMITGVDLVKEQIKVANGEELSIKQNELNMNGHAVECRVYAEDVKNNFAPSTGKITHHRLPSGHGIRVDRGIELLSDVPVYYDPMLSKVIAWGKNRQEAITRIIRALSEYQISGVITNITALRWVLEHPKFIDGSFDINFVDNEFIPLLPDQWQMNGQSEYEEVAAVLSALLKEKETELKPINIDCNPSNKWSRLNYE